MHSSRRHRFVIIDVDRYCGSTTAEELSRMLRHVKGVERETLPQADFGPPVA